MSWDDISVARKADDSIKTDVSPLVVKGTTYSITTDVPQVKISVEGTKATVEIENTSSYAIELTWINFSVLKPVANIEDWNGTARLLDVAEEAVSAKAPIIPWDEVLFDDLTTFEIARNSTLVYVLEVKGDGVKLEPAYYTVDIDWIDFLYVDGDDKSFLINKTY